MSNRITHEQAEKATNALCALVANGADEVCVEKGCKALLNALDQINQRLSHRSDSYGKEQQADRKGC